MGKLTALDWIALILVIIGGLNWGLFGIFSFDLVAAIFGDMSVIARIVYILVCLCAIYLIFASCRFARKQAEPVAAPPPPPPTTPPPAEPKK
jgi:uncharacterized membrane protein YuzA (DUF378 family)